MAKKVEESTGNSRDPLYNQGTKRQEPIQPISDELYDNPINFFRFIFLDFYCEEVLKATLARLGQKITTDP